MQLYFRDALWLAVVVLLSTGLYFKSRDSKSNQLLVESQQEQIEELKTNNSELANVKDDLESSRSRMKDLERDVKKAKIGRFFASRGALLRKLRRREEAAAAFEIAIRNSDHNILIIDQLIEIYTESEMENEVAELQKKRAVAEGKSMTDFNGEL